MKKLITAILCIFILCSCDPIISDKGIVKSVKQEEVLGQDKYYVRVELLNSDGCSWSAFRFITDELYQIGDTIIITK